MKKLLSLFIVLAMFFSAVVPVGVVSAATAKPVLVGNIYWAKSAQTTDPAGTVYYSKPSAGKIESIYFGDLKSNWDANTIGWFYPQGTTGITETEVNGMDNNPSTPTYNGYVLLNVTVPSAGVYTLNILCAGPNARAYDITVNGAFALTTSPPTSNSLTSAQTYNTNATGTQHAMNVLQSDVTLNAGANAISLTGGGTALSAPYFIALAITQLQDYVPIPPDSVTVSAASSTVPAGKTLQLAAAVSPSNADNTGFTWSVANGTGSATISAAGLLTAVSEGTVTVQAASVPYGVVSAPYTVTITPPDIQPTGVTITSPSNTMTAGQTMRFAVSVAPDNAHSDSISWAVTNGTGSATIDQNGLLTAVTAGTVTVSATSMPWGVKSNNISVTITESDYQILSFNMSAAQVNSVTVAAKDPANAWLILASYDAGGRMTARQRYNLQSAGIQIVYTAFDITGADKTMAYLWDHNFVPLTEAVKAVPSPVDPALAPYITKLGDDIQLAKSGLGAASEGTDTGQYLPGAMAAYSAGIAAANAVYAANGPTVDDLCAAIENLQDAAAEFESHKVNPLVNDGDVLDATMGGAGRSQLFDDGWKFYLAAANSNIGADNPAYNDSGWTNVTLPHDWMILNTQNLTTSNYVAGIGWYRKTFTLPDSDMGKRVFLRFDGVYMNSTCWVNGVQVGNWPYGYTTFEYDITDALHYGGQPNVVAVSVNYQVKNTRWYSGAGIYRNVWLTAADPVHVNFEGTYDTADPATGGVTLDTEIYNQSAVSKTVTVTQSVYAPDGSLVAAHDAPPVTIPANTVGKASQVITVPNPQLWDLDTPNLYTVKSEIKADGVVTDTYSDTVGFKTTRFDPNTGFWLNGRNVKVDGVCMHHDQGALGAALNYASLYRQLKIMKSMGVNAIRTSHNPPDPALVQICDRLGLLVKEEAFDCWATAKNSMDYARFFNDWSERDTRNMVRRDRNHVSVFIWSIGNEISDTNTTNGPTMAARLRDFVRAEDPRGNRPVTFGSNSPTNANAEATFAVLDLYGCNYARGYSNKLQTWTTGNYDKLHTQFPNAVLFGSETSSMCSSRGIYDFNSAYSSNMINYQCPSYDNCGPSWSISAEAAWIEYRDRPFVFGEFIWTGFDYIGEPTPSSDYTKTKNSFFGAVDTAGIPKDIYYFYQAAWTNTPVLNVLPHWDWAGVTTPADGIPVWVYSNAASVELFQDGVSLGKKSIDMQHATTLHYEWKVPWRPGQIRAVSYDKNGNIILVKTVNTPSAPANLKVRADRGTIKADGKDLSYITVSVLDGQNNFCANASNRVYFTVSGAGRLVGVDNGNSNDFDSYQASDRKAFSGKCVAIVQSDGTGGPITLTATSPGLQPASVTLNSVAVVNSPTPKPPVNLKMTSVSNNSIGLGWDAADSVGTSYVVSYNGGSVNAAGTSAVITGLNPGTAYTFSVVAVSDAGRASASSAPLTAATLPAGAVTTPVAVGVGAVPAVTNQSTGVVDIAPALPASVPVTLYNGTGFVSAAAGVAWNTSNFNPQDAGKQTLTGALIESGFINPAGLTASVAVTLNPLPVTQITVTGGDTITTSGGTVQLTAAVSPDNAYNKAVAWSVQNVPAGGAARAVVSQNGLVTAVNDGVVLVTATAADGSGVSGSMQITITGQAALKPAYSPISGPSYDVAQGVKLAVNTTGTDQSGSTVTALEGMNKGDWLGYKMVDFGATQSVMIQIAGGTTGSPNIEVRLGGPTGQLLQTCAFTSTGNYYKYKTMQFTLSGLTGVQDIYLCFPDGAFVLQYFDFIPFFAGASTNFDGKSTELVGNLFDGNMATKWYTSTSPTSAAPIWIKWGYGAPYRVSSYSLSTANDRPQRDPYSWTLQGSNDGVNYTVIDTQTNYALPTARNATADFALAQPVSYQYYQLVITDINAAAGTPSPNGVQLSEITLHPSPSAFDYIEGGSYAKGGTTYETSIAEGRQSIINIDSNNSAVFQNIDFGAAGCSQIEIKGATTFAGAQISIQVGSNPAVIVPFAQTSDTAGVYAVQTFAVPSYTGVNDVKLTFLLDNGEKFNLNYFRFIQ